MPSMVEGIVRHRRCYRLRSMTLPAPRKDLSTPGLLRSIRQCFSPIEDSRQGCEIPLVDALMSGLAVFGLKYPSLLKFDEHYHDEPVVRANLKSLYAVNRAPCDTQLRTRLDGVKPQSLRPAFRAVHRHLQRHKVLESYRYLDGYLVSIDGTGQFASSAISCPECCCKGSGEKISYYHQLLAGVIVHPAHPTVLPVMPEAITRQDGASKNDCERNAAKRLLNALRADHPKLPFIVVEDSLASNGPHIRLLESLNMRYILGAKEGDHQALFETVQQR
ncbi:MAG: transposase, partial [Candidatus Competibacteraceae bacterium]|nr:transposase [Candidatus Competibacteraceae bacterium]